MLNALHGLLKELEGRVDKLVKALFFKAECIRSAVVAKFERSVRGFGIVIFDFVQRVVVYFAHALFLGISQLAVSAAQSLVIEILAKLFVEGLVKIIGAWNKVIEKGGTTVVGGIFVVGKRIDAFNLIRKVA